MTYEVLACPYEKGQKNFLAYESNLTAFIFAGVLVLLIIVSKLLPVIILLFPGNLAITWCQETIILLPIIFALGAPPNDEKAYL